jgi:peptide subunit release factor 1 (eRF1)
VSIAQPLSAQLDRLASLTPDPYPVISLYLNLQPDDRGRDRYDAFVRKMLPERLATYPAEGPERASLERDGEKIRTYLQTVDASANGLALFACSGADLFEAIPLAAPIIEHRLYISNQPHLYPLARVIDEYPRYAVLVADTHRARMFVVAANAVERATGVESDKTKRHKMGGWSQARYQRNVDNFRTQHAKEAVEVLTRIVRDEQIPSIVIGGDEVVVPMLKRELPKDITERVVEVLPLDIRAPEGEILRSSLEALRRQDEQSDRERVDALLDAYRGSGLGSVGVDSVTRALELGQVQELLIAARADAIDTGGRSNGAASSAERSTGERVADDLIAKARQTAAAVRFIQDSELLAPFGGVGAFLRFAL